MELQAKLIQNFSELTPQAMAQISESSISGDEKKEMTKDIVLELKLVRFLRFFYRTHWVGTHKDIMGYSFEDIVHPMRLDFFFPERIWSTQDQKEPDLGGSYLHTGSFFRLKAVIPNDEQSGKLLKRIRDYDQSTGSSLEFTVNRVANRRLANYLQNVSSAASVFIQRNRIQWHGRHEQSRPTKKKVQGIDAKSARPEATFFTPGIQNEIKDLFDQKEEALYSRRDRYRQIATSLQQSRFFTSACSFLFSGSTSRGFVLELMNIKIFKAGYNDRAMQEDEMTALITGLRNQVNRKPVVGTDADVTSVPFFNDHYNTITLAEQSDALFKYLLQLLDTVIDQVQQTVGTIYPRSNDPQKTFKNNLSRTVKFARGNGLLLYLTNAGAIPSFLFPKYSGPLLEPLRESFHAALQSKTDLQAVWTPLMKFRNFSPLPDPPDYNIVDGPNVIQSRLKLLIAIWKAISVKKLGEIWGELQKSTNDQNKFHIDALWTQIGQYRAFIALGEQFPSIISRPNDTSLNADFETLEKKGFTTTGMNFLVGMPALFPMKKLIHVLAEAVMILLTNKMIKTALGDVLKDKWPEKWNIYGEIAQSLSVLYTLFSDSTAPSADPSDQFWQGIATEYDTFATLLAITDKDHRNDSLHKHNEIKDPFHNQELADTKALLRQIAENIQVISFNQPHIVNFTGSTSVFEQLTGSNSLTSQANAIKNSSDRNYLSFKLNVNPREARTFTANSYLTQSLSELNKSREESNQFSQASFPFRSELEWELPNYDSKQGQIIPRRSDGDAIEARITPISNKITDLQEYLTEHQEFSLDEYKTITAKRTELRNDLILRTELASSFSQQRTENSVREANIRKRYEMLQYMAKYNVPDDPDQKKLFEDINSFLTSPIEYRAKLSNRLIKAIANGGSFNAVQILPATLPSRNVLIHVYLNYRVEKPESNTQGKSKNTGLTRVKSGQQGAYIPPHFVRDLYNSMNLPPDFFQSMKNQIWGSDANYFGAWRGVALSNTDPNCDISIPVDQADNIKANLGLLLGLTRRSEFADHYRPNPAGAPKFPFDQYFANRENELKKLKMPTSDRYWDAEAIKRVPSLNDWINLPLHWWGTKIAHERDHIARCQHVAKDLANKPNERQHMNRVNAEKRLHFKSQRSLRAACFQYIAKVLIYLRIHANPKEIHYEDLFSLRQKPARQKKSYAGLNKKQPLMIRDYYDVLKWNKNWTIAYSAGWAQNKMDGLNPKVYKMVSAVNTSKYWKGDDAHVVDKNNHPNGLEVNRDYVYAYPYCSFEPENDSPQIIVVDAHVNAGRNIALATPKPKSSKPNNQDLTG